MGKHVQGTIVIKMFEHSSEVVDLSATLPPDFEQTYTHISMTVEVYTEDGDDPVEALLEEALAMSMRDEGVPDTDTIMGWMTETN